MLTTELATSLFENFLNFVLLVINNCVMKLKHHSIVFRQEHLRLKNFQGEDPDAPHNTLRAYCPQVSRPPNRKSWIRPCS